MTSFSGVFQSAGCFKGIVRSIKLGGWGGEGNCLLPKQMDTKRCLDSSTEGEAQQRREIQFLRNRDSLAEAVMPLLCVCRDVLHWAVFSWEAIWDVQEEGMLLIASFSSCKCRPKHTFSQVKRCVLWTYVHGPL